MSGMVFCRLLSGPPGSSQNDTVATDDFDFSLPAAGTNLQASELGQTVDGGRWVHAREMISPNPRNMVGVVSCEYLG